MAAACTTPDIVDKKPLAATPALQPTALIGLAALTTSKPQPRQLSDAAPRAGAITPMIVMAGFRASARAGVTFAGFCGAVAGAPCVTLPTIAWPPSLVARCNRRSDFVKRPARWPG